MIIIYTLSVEYNRIGLPSRVQYAAAGANSSPGAYGVLHAVGVARRDEAPVAVVAVDVPAGSRVRAEAPGCAADLATPLGGASEGRGLVAEGLLEDAAAGDAREPGTHVPLEARQQGRGPS